MGKSEPVNSLYGRPFAYCYLVTLSVLVAGIVSSTIDRGALWSILLTLGAGLSLTVLANVLARRDPLLRAQRGSFMRLSGYQSGWYRLILGAELAPSWRVVRRHAPVTPQPVAATSPPESSESPEGLDAYRGLGGQLPAVIGVPLVGVGLALTADNAAEVAIGLSVAVVGPVVPLAWPKLRALLRRIRNAFMGPGEPF